MKSYTLSPRMQVIADFAKDSKTIADIGCDHGKVSVELAKSGAYVYAVDISEPSLQKARELAKTENTADRMEFYCADGLNDIKNVELDAIIIAGMGWRMIGGILESNIQCVKKAKKLVLQPMDSTIELREYLCRNNYAITNEKLVIDEGRIYTVICCEYGNGKKLSVKEMLFGSKIIEHKDILIPELARREREKREKKLAGLLMASKRDRMTIKRIKKEIRILKRQEAKK
ncbi:MAG: class I SAM-dependent methyltransferase [Eubacteriales bacterium]